MLLRMAAGNGGSLQQTRTGLLNLYYYIRDKRFQGQVNLRFTVNFKVTILGQCKG